MTPLAKRAEETRIIPLKRKTASAVPTIARIAIAEKPFIASELSIKTVAVFRKKKPKREGKKTSRKPREVISAADNSCNLYLIVFKLRPYKKVARIIAKI